MSKSDGVRVSKRDRIKMSVRVSVCVCVCVCVCACVCACFCVCAERLGAGVEYHFQEFNEPYAPS